MSITAVRLIMTLFLMGGAMLVARWYLGCWSPWQDYAVAAPFMYLLSMWIVTVQDFDEDAGQ